MCKLARKPYVRIACQERHCMAQFQSINSQLY
uniref:Uncharacterized protein n=1 Tax=Anguilla anguilla TaxID=7936 RepID=A0A0E9UZE8_ANGAN